MSRPLMRIVGRSGHLVLCCVASQLLAVPAVAACWAGGDQEARKLQVLVEDDPARALRRIGNLGLPPVKSTLAEREMFVWHASAKIEALNSLLRLGETQKIAVQLQSIGPVGPAATMEIRIRTSQLDLAGSADDLQRAISDFRRLLKNVSAGSAASICGKVAMAELLRAAGDLDGAIRSVSSAYREAKTKGLEQEAAAIALSSSAFVGLIGDFAEADAFATEAEDWARKSRRRYSMLMAIYQRAQMMRLNRDARALPLLDQIVQQGPALEFPLTTVFANACRLSLDVGDVVRAKRTCEAAAAGADPNDPAGFALTKLLRGELLLAQGEPEKSIALLNEALSSDLPPLLAVSADKARIARAKAFADTGQHENAYKDALAVIGNVLERSEKQSAKDLMLSRARFSWNRQRIANQELANKLEIEAQRAELRRVWLLAVGIGSAFAIVMLGLLAALERRRRRLVSAMAQKDQEIARLKSEVFTTLSHEIRSPLGSLVLATETLIGDLEAGGKENPLARRVAGVASRLIGHLDDLLLFSQIDSQGLRINSTAVDIAAVARSVVNSLREQAMLSKIDLRAEISPDEDHIAYADPRRVDQVLLNLVGNAIKHSGASEIRVFVDRDASGRVRIKVQDDGKGIPKTQQDKLFQRFSDAKEKKTSASGFGLGLPISKGLVEAMKGAIFFEQIDRGTCLTVILPAFAGADLHKREEYVP